ncbi:hypothetical protein B0H13DRAFT_1854906 [Mycena leptocephala]|nr:hypothetical protein B0H13DRAFT_1854906 [Mycena leptocephala]
MCSLRRQRPVPHTSRGVCEHETRSSVPFGVRCCDQARRQREGHTDMPAIRMAELWAPTREVRKADEGRILLTSQLLRSVGVLHRDGDFPDSSAAFGRRILNNPTEMNPCPAGVQDELGNSRIGEASWVAICGGRTLLEIDGVRESLDLLYGISVELNQVIEEKLPGRPSQSHLRPSTEWGFMLLTLEQTPVKIQTQLDFHGQRETLPRIDLDISVAAWSCCVYACPLYLLPSIQVRSRFEIPPSARGEDSIEGNANAVTRAVWQHGRFSQNAEHKGLESHFRMDRKIEEWL